VGRQAGACVTGPRLLRTTHRCGSQKGSTMLEKNIRLAGLRVAGVVVLAGLGLSACATEDYVNQHIAAVNARIDQVDAKATEAGQHADAAMQAAQAANATAQAAQASAAQANSRLDALTGRVDVIEQRLAAKPPRN